MSPQPPPPDPDQPPGPPPGGESGPFQPIEGSDGSGGSKKGLFIGLGVGAVVLIAAIAVTLALVLGGGGGATGAVRTLIDATGDQECGSVDDVVHEDYQSFQFFTSTEECEDQLEMLEDQDESYALDIDIRALDEIDDPESIALDEDAENEQVAVRGDLQLEITRDGDFTACGEIVFEFLVEDVDGDWRVKQDTVIEQNELDEDDC